MTAKLQTFSTFVLDIESTECDFAYDADTEQLGTAYSTLHSRMGEGTACEDKADRLATDHLQKKMPQS